MTLTRRQFFQDATTAVVAGSFMTDISNALAEDTPAVSEHLDEVLAMLNIPFEGNTPLEKQESILRYFRNRKHVSIWDLYYDHRECANYHSSYQAVHYVPTYSGIAELALEHKFRGQLAYEPDFRGKDDIDWDRNPTNDLEWLWQFHRFYWQEALAVEYARTGNEKFAQEWAFEMRSWIRNMHDPKRLLRHAGWRSLDAADRIRTWSCNLEFFLKSPALDSRLLVDIIYSFQTHIKLLEPLCKVAQQRPSLGNWDIYHAEGLLFATIAFPERKTSQQEAILATNCLIQFQKKVTLADGVINEYTPTYHRAYPIQFARLIRICDALKLPVEIPQEYRDRLEKSIDAMAIWSHPDGTSPVYGDAWLYTKDANREYLSQFLPLYDRPDWKYFVTHGKEGTPPSTRMQELPAAGYYTMRSDWTDQATFIVVKNSNTRSLGHNHADNMTFEMSAFGERLMSDTGCYTYSGDADLQNYARLSSSHQLVTLNNRNVASRGRKIASYSIEAKSGLPSMDILSLENEPADGLIHKRTFTFIDKRFFVIVDELSGSTSGELHQHYQLLPGDWNWNNESFKAITTHSGHANLILVQAKSPNVTYVQERGLIFPAYQVKQERPAFAFVQKKESNAVCRFATMLIPVAPNIDITKVPVTIALDDSRHVQVQFEDKSWNFEIL